MGRFSNELLWELVDPQFTFPIDQTNVVVSDTHTFNPTMINEFRFGFNRRHRPTAAHAEWQLGAAVRHSERERRDISGYPGAHDSRYYNFGPGGLDEQLAQDYTFQNNMTKIVGKHTLKFGYEVVRTTYNSLVESFPSGRYNMAGTELPFTPNTGNRFANFLLGTVAVHSSRKRGPVGSRGGFRTPCTSRPIGSRFAT